MSRHSKRKETDCLNCGTQVIGNFCHNCGQENIHPKQSVWHLVSHFFKDITHFDGKFFTSLRYLVFNPGFLSKEYIAGRRVRYLDPIRMYLFTSAIFFLIFFSLYQVDEKSLDMKATFRGKTSEQITKMDSTEFSEFTKKVNKGKPLSKAEVFTRLDSGNFNLGPGNYRSRAEYDSVLKSGVKKHNWWQKQLIYKNFELKEKYNSNPRAIIAALVNKFIHWLPQMLFVLLPLFALTLKLVYVRRKNFYYVDHVIFTIHLYIFLFLIMLITFGISKAKNLLDWDWLTYLRAAFVLSIFFYFYKALRNFYKQRRAKTILKYFILLFLFFLITLFTFIVFMFFSIFGI